jgi:hypothetical protein
MLFPQVANNKSTTLATAGGISAADVACSLQDPFLGSPSYKVVLCFDPTDPAKVELVRLTLAGTAVTQMERNYGGVNPAGAQAHDFGCEVRLTTPAEYVNLLLAHAEDGWSPVPDYLAAAYVSATTFTLQGDWSGTLSKGDKLRLTNGSTKYFYVVSAAYGAGTTTVTVTGGSDYALASAAVTAVSYSKASSPAGFPKTFAWNPNPSGYSSAPTGVVARFSVNGGACTYSYYASGDGTSNATSKTYSLPLPTASGSGTIGTFVTQVKDNGTAAYGKHVLAYNSSTATCYPSQSAPSWAASGTCNHVQDGVLISYPI